MRTHKIRMILVLVALVAASLACQTLSGGGNNGSNDPVADPNVTPSPNATLTAIFAPLDETQDGSDDDAALTETPEDGDAEATATIEVVEGDTPPIDFSGLDAGEKPTPIYLQFEEDVDPNAELTPTVEATPTPEITGYRPGPSLYASFQETRPNIDGNLADWNGPVYAAERVVFGEAFYAGYDDLHATFQLGWDNEFLYIGVSVSDTKFIQTALGPQLYQGDSVEVLLDTNVLGDYFSHNLTEDDYQLGFSPGNLEDEQPPEAFMWTPVEKAGPFTRLSLAAVRTAAGYDMEIAIPWFMVEVVPAGNMHFGFQLSFSDNDAVNENMQQSVVSFGPWRVIHDPTYWYDLVLLP